LIIKGVNKMSYIKKSYCYKQKRPLLGEKQGSNNMRVYHGHISKATAIKHGFYRVTLKIIDMSGKGRGESRYFVAPFENMSKFN
tara:strand:+ start:235 stop:486 length:252 start_codon:yes stop_codon:yes gene_type:complete